MKKKN